MFNRIIIPTLALLLLVCSSKLVNASEKCINAKVLIYHHVRDNASAKAKGQSSLNVSPEMFEKQMKYLQEQKYKVIGLDELYNMINNGNGSSKIAVITFDDGYEDNYLYAYPILKKYNHKATIFMITGLAEVAEYLKWSQIDDMKNSGIVSFGSHTWSHYSASDNKTKMESEYSMADKQLSDHGINTKTFAYPYGKVTKTGQEELQKLGYKLAFTTKKGARLCNSNLLTLPRVRVGNAQLSNYGL